MSADPPTLLTSSPQAGGEPGSEGYLAPHGYELGVVIGRGGMGEVFAAVDRRIGREVAIKRMRAEAPEPDQIRRFLREARVQARLDHPAIVPVHELGYDADGRPYFTMKRLAGTTLTELLPQREIGSQRLLRALVDVALAVELAHTRGVVHRDLKPSNIMLGDYGEVYVLDWGIARVIGEADAGGSPSGEMAAALLTQTGDLLGTPGYMAPEQLSGTDVGPAADVWALGAILYEVLTREPLFPRGTAGIAETLAQGPDGPGGPAARKPDLEVPPELDALCADAMRRDPARRPSARQLAERIQRYLDGDRDVAHRRALAAESLAAALVAFRREGADTRADAMRLAGRALALDPTSKDAAALVSRLILEPPAVPPPELEATIADGERRLDRQQSRTGALALCAIAALSVAALGLDVQSPRWLAAVVLGLLGTAAYSWLGYKRDFTAAWGVALMMLVLSIPFSRVVGPLLLPPIVICTLALALGASPAFAKRSWLVTLWVVAMMLVPLLSEALGLLPRTWGAMDDRFWFHSTIYHVNGARDEVVLAGTTISVMVTVTLFTRSTQAARARLQRTTETQAWHLRKLLPDERP